MKRAITLLILLGAFAFSVGCSQPAKYSSSEMHPFDEYTRYQLDERTEGFALTVHCKRYQFVPQITAVQDEGKSALIAIAHDIAEKRARKIKPIDPQRIRMSTGRNGITGNTSWSGHTVVYWAD